VPTRARDRPAALTLEQLARTTRCSRGMLRFVLDDEQGRGRVERDDGGFRLIREAFPAPVLAALRALERL